MTDLLYLFRGAVIAAMAFAPATVHAQPVADLDVDRIESAFRAVFPDDGPGAALIVAHDGDILLRAEAGYADVEAEKPFTTRSLTYVASNAKPMVASAILDMAEAGEISIDAPLSAYMPDLPEIFGQAMIRHHLSHQSGFFDYSDVFADYWLQHRIEDNDALIEAMARNVDAQWQPPGERFGYTNFGYVLLAELIEEVSGRSFQDYMQAELFRPLGMADTFVAAPGVLPEEAAIPYAVEDGSFYEYDERNNIRGQAGVYSTAEDMMRFLLAVRNGEAVPARFMDEVRVASPTDSGRPSPYSLGWQAESIDRGPLAGLRYASSFGVQGGYRTAVFWYFDQDVQLVLLSNAAGRFAFEPVADSLFVPSAGE